MYMCTFTIVSHQVECLPVLFLFRGQLHVQYVCDHGLTMVGRHVQLYVQKWSGRSVYIIQCTSLPMQVLGGELLT